MEITLFCYVNVYLNCLYLFALFLEAGQDLGTNLHLVTLLLPLKSLDKNNIHSFLYITTHLDFKGLEYLIPGKYHILQLRNISQRNHPAFLEQQIKLIRYIID